MPSATSTNYFILLELDPDKRWNQDEFERTLASKQQAWARLLTHPAKGMQAKAYLGLIPKIKATMTDDAARAAQAAEARTLLRAEVQEKGEELENTLRLMEKKGYVTPDELADLTKRYAGVFSESEIRERIRVRVQEVKDTTTATKPRLDPSAAKEIASLLDQIGKENLYDFLGGTRKTQTTALHDAANRIYQQCQLHAVKSADITVGSKLSGYCMDIFKSDADRARYDETLRQSAYDGLRKQLDLIGRSSREVLAPQVEELLRQARAQGLDVEQARQAIKEYVQAKKWAIELVTTESVEELLVCGVCYAINKPAAQFCESCGKPLRLNCPRCKELAPSDQRACSKCGFPIGNYAFASYLLEEGKRAGEGREYAEAEEYLSRAARAWSQELQDRLSREIARALAEIQKAVQERRALLEELRQLRTAKQYLTLRERLTRVGHLFPEGSTDLLAWGEEAERAIREANALFVKARQAQSLGRGDPVPLCQRALWICRDHAEAREMMSKTPPQPPHGLAAQASGGTVRLRWKAGASRGVRHRVVRKVRTQPVSAQDGKLLDTVSGLAYDDPQAPVGVPVYYAVYADREGVLSVEGAQVSAPVFITQDIGRPVKRVGDGVVHLSWSPPPNVQKVVAARSDIRYPPSPRAGGHIPTLNNRELIDRAVINGRKYYYTLFCEFRGPGDRPAFSSGFRISAIPQTPPVPPTLELQAIEEGEERVVRLSWKRPSKGEVAVLKSDAPNLRSGSVIPLQEVEGQGTLLPALSEPLTDRLKRLGTVYYTPLVIFQEVAYVGKAVAYTCIDDVRDLRVQNLGHALRLRWDWPAGCNEALIAVGYEGWPDGGGDREVVRSEITRAEYDISGSYDVEQPGERDHYVVVHAVINQEGRRLVAEGARAGARQYVALGSRITLHYEVHKPLWRRRSRLRLEVDGEEGWVPRLLLVRKFGGLPLDVADGERVFEIASFEADGRRHAFWLPEGIERPRAFVKLFLADDQAYDRVIVRHPSQDKLRLFT